MLVAGSHALRGANTAPNVPAHGHAKTSTRPLRPPRCRFNMALFVIGAATFAVGIELATTIQLRTNLATGTPRLTSPYLGVGVPLVVVGMVLASYATAAAKRNLRRVSPCRAVVPSGRRPGRRLAARVRETDPVLAAHRGGIDTEGV